MSEQELAAAGELGTSYHLPSANPSFTFTIHDMFTESTCPICFVPFSTILAEHETAAAMESPAHPIEELGITKLSKTCGHIFCRKE